MSKTIPRRALLKAAVCSATVIPAAILWQRANAAAPASAPMLDKTDPTAQALGYVPNAATVDKKTNPTYMAGQHCAVCAQFQGKATDKQGPCVLFPGKLVNAAGWCRGWGKKPG
ncbi:MAG TPA: high-potential iron-sulfur protein [Steroidobacteraceae bacterium]|nr:high-potential iron-sulfur protein [Steroidobacteraceae bacterium]